MTDIKEPIYMSRRIWAAGLNLVVVIAIVAFPERSDLIIQGALVLASGLGITSFFKPKA